MPDLSEEGGFEQEGQGWRGGGGGNDGGYSSGGGYKHQRNPSYGNGSNFNKGGDRGGDRGGDNNRGGGGNWHNRQNSDNGYSKGNDWRKENTATTSTWGNSQATTNDWKAGNTEDDYATKIQGKYGVPSGNSSKSSAYAYSTPSSTVSTPNPYNDTQKTYGRAPQQQSNLDATVYVKNLSFQTDESELTAYFK